MIAHKVILRCAVVVLLVIVAVLFCRVAYIKVKYHYDVGNAVLRTLFPPDKEVVWAEGFTESEFSLVVTGMSKQQVIGLVGEPLVRWYNVETSNDAVWSYAYCAPSDTRGNYDARNIHFDSNGAVRVIARRYHREIRE